MSKMWRGNFVAMVLGTALVLAAFGGVAAAEEFKQFGVRTRALLVYPDSKTDSRLNGLDIEAKLAVAPELDLEYFFTRNVSTELILGVTKHDITAGGRALGSTWLLPPTLTLKYHPLPSSKVSPYVGLGINYIIPFEDKANGVLNVSDFHIKNSFGWAAQVGTDVAMGNNWYFNLDLKYLKAETDATINGTVYDLHLNPYIIGAGVGYRF